MHSNPICNRSRNQICLRLKNSYTLTSHDHFSLPIIGLLGTTLLFSDASNSNNPAANKQDAKGDQTASTLALTAPESPSDKAVSATQQNSGRHPNAQRKESYDPATIALASRPRSLFFAQFVCAGVEIELLERIDHGIEDTLIAFQATDPQNAEASLFAPVKQMTADLNEAVSPNRRTTSERLVALDC